MHVFDLPPDLQSDLSVKDFLRRKIGLSLSAWRKLKANGEILLDQTPILPNQPLLPGKKLTIRWTRDTQLEAIEMPLNIVFEDDALLVLEKPAGLLVHPSSLSSEKTLANGVSHYFKMRNPYWHFHPVHRLDRNTSGLLVVAKTPHVQHKLTQEGFAINRKYWALVEGNVNPREGRIDLPIARHPDSIILRRVSLEGQPALTLYRTLQQTDAFSWLEIELQTGRTHQIRVHLSALGHPLLGDDLYGGSINLLPRQALHSCALSFKHPLNGNTISLQSTWPSDIENLLRRNHC